MKHTLLLFAFALSCMATKADHFRGIDLLSTQLAGNSFKVHADVYMDLTGVTGTTYLHLDYGDGTIDSLPMIPGTGAAYPAIDIEMFSFGEAHTFAADGVYTLTFTVKYWSNGIVNITSPATTTFIGEMKIVINPFLGANHFGGFNYNMTDAAIVSDDYSFDMSTIEPDGDSVVFTQQPASQLAVPGSYQYPSSLGGAESLVSQVYHFDNMVATGQYAVSYRVEEYRTGQLIAAHLREFSLEYAGVLGLPEPGKNQNVLFPNPCTHSVYIPSTGNGDTFSLYEMNGKLLFSAPANQITDVSFLHPGMYLVKTPAGKAQKLVKE